MNVFNRIAMSLVLVLFIAATLLVSLLPRAVISALRPALDLAQSNLDGPTQLVGALLGLAVAAGALLLLLAELRPAARQSVIVAQVAGGTAELTNESVSLRVKRVAESIDGVRDAAPFIHSRGHAVDVVLRLTMELSADVPKKTEEVMQTVRSEVEGKMGIPVKALRVTVRHASGESRFFKPASGAPRTGTEG